MTARTPEDVHRLWGEALNAGDLESAVSLYEPGASVVEEPGKVVTGIPAIRKLLAGYVALKPRIQLTVKNTVQAGDLALLITPWTLSGTGPDGSAVLLAGTTSDVVRRQANGTWLFIIDNAYGTA